jgi:hypothetical protein
MGKRRRKNSHHARQDVERVKSGAEPSSLRRNRAIRNFRITLALIFTLTAVSILALHWKEVASVETTANLIAGEFSTTLGKPWTTDPIKIKSLAVSNLAELSLEQAGVERGVFDPGTETFKHWVRLGVENLLRVESLEDLGSISIESEPLTANLSIGEEARVTFTTSEQNRNRLRLLINGTATVSLDVGEQLLLTCNQCRIRNVPADRFELGGDILRVKVKNREIGFRNVSGTMTIDLEIVRNQDGSKPYLLGNNIDVTGLDFTRLEGDSRRSTIVEDGIINLPGLGEKKIEVKSFDFVEFDELMRFQIRQLSLGDRLGVALQGTAGDLRTGPESGMRSRVPSYLEWLYANRFLRLFLAILIPVFSTILAVFYRLRIVDGD